MDHKEYVGNFCTTEFSSKDGQDSPYPMVVKMALIELCNEIRSEFGKPVIVTSGYRSPSHNAKVGGVPNSYHTKGMAADLRPEDLKDLPRLQWIADKINMYGGVGYYDTFVHVDIRGKRARWDYRKEK